MSEHQQNSNQNIAKAVPVWGHLFPLTNGLPTHNCTKNNIIFGRLKQCQIQINQKRFSSKHCEIYKRGNQIFLRDLSTNGTYVKDEKVGKNNQIQIFNGTQIWLLSPTKVSPTETIGFKLQLVQNNDNKQDQVQQLKKQQLQQYQRQKKAKIQEEVRQREKKIQQLENNKNKLQNFSEKIKNQITCAYCFQIMHDPVNVQPCNHRFCGGCLSDLVKHKKDLCIICRRSLKTAVKDPLFKSIIQDYLITSKEEKRSQLQIQELNKKNIFSYDPTDIVMHITGKPIKAKVSTIKEQSRIGRAFRNSQDSHDEPHCRECIEERDGFRCDASQKHIRCVTCGKYMADRDNKDFHQYCVICTQYFCNIYSPPCGDGVKLGLIKDRRNQVRINTETMRGNQFQFTILRNFLLQKKMTSKEVFDTVMKQVEKGGFSYLQDRKLMNLGFTAPKQTKIMKNDAVCDRCWKELWFQFIFFYRNTIILELPKNIHERQSCFWGVNCLTMKHDAEHAKRFNHMQFQTRF